MSTFTFTHYTFGHILGSGDWGFDPLTDRALQSKLSLFEFADISSASATVSFAGQTNGYALLGWTLATQGISAADFDHADSFCQFFTDSTAPSIAVPLDLINFGTRIKGAVLGNPPPQFSALVIGTPSAASQSNSLGINLRITVRCSGHGFA